ncbi:MAG: flagellar biosynthesis protein FlhA [Deltaproteobacteria bacterium]|jgi:flagellar biosynthesis protein FlhA|nr:flagellar biosynthesis protein FlhA [Deltaproteobacteria bacterium]
MADTVWGRLSERVSGKGSGNMIIGLGVVGILMVFLFPLPTKALDLFLTFNVAISVIVLLTAMYTLKPLDFSVFPSLLLILTLCRLALNIASTRLILLNGSVGTAAAGEVIQAFGNFVVGGNYVVGVIIFAILVVINFMVITKGSGRIAEVAARFTLDAMPGKQMAIDADLAAGLIQEAEAKGRREVIAREADFYGAMDGASKFVRGDAIAGIIITLINIVGGFVIGVLQEGMSPEVAASTYTIMTVGDGLVSQLPALMVSTAAGIIVSRAGSEATMSSELVAQFTFKPEALALSGGVIFFLGLLPGLPTIAFCLTGVVVLSASFAVYRRRRLDRAAMEGGSRRPIGPAGGPASAPGPPGTAPAPGSPGTPPAPGAKAPAVPERMEALLPLDVLELEVGYGLIPLVDDEQGGELMDRIRSIRRQFALESGFIVPLMHVRDNLQLRPGEYAILIKGDEVARAEMLIGHQLAMDPGDARKTVPGIPTQEPAFGLNALWISEDHRDEAQHAGWTVVDLASVMATHLTEVVRNHADELISRQDVQKLIDGVAQTNDKVVEELVPNLLSLGQIQKVLQNLLKERVSIRDMPSILEDLADHAQLTRDTDLLTEFVRQKLARGIIRNYVVPSGELPLMTIGQDIEETLSRSINETERGAYLALDPDTGQRILTAVSNAVTQLTSQNFQPVVLCSPMVRRHLRKLTERFLTNLVVISHSELTNNIRLKILGEVTFSYAD